MRTPMPPPLRGRFVLIGLLACAAAAAAAAGPPPATPDWACRLDPFLRAVALGVRVTDGPFSRLLAAGSEEALRTLPPFVRAERAEGRPLLYVKAGIDASPAGLARLDRALADAGGRRRARVGGITSLAVPPAALERLAALPEVRWLRSARSYRTMNDVSTSSGFVASRDANSVFGTRGAGVIIAVIDTGIDWRSRDFIDPVSGSTRILGIWDQTLDDAAHPPPAGFDFGAYYSRADIDAALAGGGTLATGDGYGHATHVAGSALGNGQATGGGVTVGTFAGVAPQADLLIVRVFDNGGTFCRACDLTAALQFVQGVAAAAAEPWVANMSLGSDIGAHDGTDPDEMTIDALVGTGRPGSQVAIAAGNSGSHKLHWQGVLAANGSYVNTFSIAAYTPATGADNDFVFLDLWYKGPDRATFTVTSPTGQAASAAYGADTGVVCTPDGAIDVRATNGPDPTNGDNEVFVQISDASACGTSPPVPKAGTWTIRIAVQSVGPAGGGPFDLWDDATVSPSGFVPLQTSASAGTVTIPTTSRNAISAGAYVGKNQWINAGGGTTNAGTTSPLGAASSFSGFGPTRDGRLKPDLSAPGEYVGSTLTGLIQQTRGTSFTERDGVHGDIAGTSMATPHAAGVAALLFALNPALDGLEARAALQAAARADGFTGTVPNMRYGFGKLRAPEAGYEAVSLVTDLSASGDGFTGSASPFIDSYDVYRGTIPGLAATNYGSCLQTGNPTPSFTDPGLPLAGQAFFYLVTGVHAGLEGILGVDSTGRIRPNTAPCP